MNTEHKKMTLDAASVESNRPNTRNGQAEIRESNGKFHIYTLPLGLYHCTCITRPDAERILMERFAAIENQASTLTPKQEK